jgi:general L-amino acid transport system substrate-binding protein
MKRFSFVLAMFAVFALIGSVSAGTLDDVKAKGFIQAGVNGDLFGFGKPDEKGVWKGLDVDTARAIAAAVFGDADKVKYTPLTAKTRFTALQSGEIDVLTRNCTQTLSRDTALGLDFAQVNYYDGQGFLVSKKLGVKSAKELDGASVCVLPGTTTELNVADYFRSNGMKMKPVVIENTAELAKAFFAGRCDCLTSDASQLAGTRAVAPIPRITSFFRKSSPRNPWHRPYGTVTTSGRISSTTVSWP